MPNSEVMDPWADAGKAAYEMYGLFGTHEIKGPWSSLDDNEQYAWMQAGVAAYKAYKAADTAAGRALRDMKQRDSDNE